MTKCYNTNAPSIGPGHQGYELDVLTLWTLIQVKSMDDMDEVVAYEPAIYVISFSSIPY